VLFPALVLGFFVFLKIDAMLIVTATTVAVALLVGGIILLFVDKKHSTNIYRSENL
jgi:undecaprenyl pyrophosphate phosphatase UppP